MWLKYGDQNTKFFHGKVKNRRKTNTIIKLKDDFGAWRSAGDHYEKNIRSYFEGIFSSPRPVSI